MEKAINKALNSLTHNNSPVRLLVFSGDNQYQVESFFVEAKEISKGRQVKIAVDQNIQRILPESKIRESLNPVDIFYSGDYPDIQKIFDGVDVVITGSMNLSNAAKIAHLISDSFSTRIVSESLLRGIRVISNDFIRGMTFSNESYQKQVHKIKGILESYGIEFFPLDQIKFLTTTAALESKLKESDSSIITESFIKQFQGKELKVSRDVVITPLAKDTINEKKINLIR